MMDKIEKRKQGRLRLCSQPICEKPSRAARTQSSLPDSDALFHGFLSQINTKKDKAQHSGDISVFLQSKDDKSKESVPKEIRNESFQTRNQSKYVNGIDEKYSKFDTGNNENNTNINVKNIDSFSKSDSKSSSPSSKLPTFRSIRPCSDSNIRNSRRDCSIKPIHNLKLQKTITSNSLDDSLTQDFKTPNVSKARIQSKLTYLKEQSHAKLKKKNHVNIIEHNPVSERIENDSLQDLKNEDNNEPNSLKTNLEMYPGDESGVHRDSNSNSGTSLADENQQRNTSLCPLCWKRFDKTVINTAHLKTCAAKHNLTTRQLLDAMELQEKQTAEREALGLPGLPTNQAAKKPGRKDSGSSVTNDANLQLALALSASMREAEEHERLCEDETLLEAGLGDEVAARQATLLERFGFTNNRPALTSINTRTRPGKVNKLKTFPTLLTRTQEERERRITEKVAIILMGEEDDVKPLSPPQVEKPSEVTSLKSEVLVRYQNKNCDLWCKASASPSRVDKTSYYTDSLSGLISPSKVEAGSKLKHLSQVPCRVKTPVRELHNSFEKDNRTTPKSESTATSPSESLSPIKHYLENSPEVRRNCGKQLRFSPSPNKRTTTVSGFSDTLATDWRSILNSEIMSDITIHVRDSNEIPAHQLVLHVRCPNVLDDVVEELDLTRNTVSKKIMWSNTTYNVALAFLEFVYCGSLNKILGLLEGLADVQWLARKYCLSDLDQHLKMIANVRVKVCSQSDGSRSPQSLSHLDVQQVIQHRAQDELGTSPRRASFSPPYRRNSESSQSLVSSLKNSPYKKPTSFNSSDKSRQRLPTKAGVAYSARSPKLVHRHSDVGFPEGEQRNVCVSRDSLASGQRSPDPFSESRTVDDLNSSLMKNTSEDNVDLSMKDSQYNLDCLLGMMNKISPSQNASGTVSLKDTKNPYKSPDLSPVIVISGSPEIVELDKDSPVPMDSSEERASTSSPLSVAATKGSPDVTTEEKNLPSTINFTSTESLLSSHSGNKNSPESRLSEKSTENKRKHSSRSPFSDDSISVKKKLCRDQTNSVKKNLFTSPTSEPESIDIRKQHHEDETVTFDLTQSSDDMDNSSHPLSPAVSSAANGQASLNSRSISDCRTTMSFVEDACLSKIKDMIASDLSFRSEHDESRTEVNNLNVSKCIKSVNSTANDSQKTVYSGHESSRNIDVETERLGDFCADYEYDFYSNYMNSPPRNMSLPVCENVEDRVANKSLSPLCKGVGHSSSENNVDGSRQPSPSPMRGLSQNSGNRGSNKLSCDVSVEIICLDDSLSPEMVPIVVSPTIKLSEGAGKSSNLSTNEGNISLNTAKCLLEDSFMDHLSNSTAWGENVKKMDMVSSGTAACSTPKQPPSRPKHTTPLQRLRGGTSNEITPPADYSAMETPLLKKELDKYGLKPLKRKQAKLILRHIYNELHPWVPADGDSDTEATNTTSPPKSGGSCSPFKKPDAETQVPKSPVKRCLSKQLTSPKKKTLKKHNERSPTKRNEVQESEDLESGSESGLSLSQSSASSVGSDYLGTSHVGEDELGLTQGDPNMDVATAVRSLITSDPELHQSVLLYEPIWVEQLHQSLKTNGFKFKLDQVVSYLDEQCITFRTAQQQSRNRARRSPKKKSKAVKLSQKEATKSKTKKKKGKTPASQLNSEETYDS